MQQINQATIVGTITQSGNALITVTAFGMGNSPKIINVPVLISDIDSVVAGKIASALALDIDVQAFFLMSSSGAYVIAKARLEAPNDLTMNVASDNGTCLGLTAQPTSTTTQQGANQTLYCDVATLKSTMNGYDGTTYDSLLTTFLINPVSRRIDKYCGRHFYQITGQKFFDSDDPFRISVPDLVSITALATDDGTRTFPYTWATTDYDLMPYNAPLNIQPEPYTAIQTTPAGKYSFPVGRYNPAGMAPIVTWESLGNPIYGITRGISVTGIWGWPEIPYQAQYACLLQCERLFKKLENPSGYIPVSVPDGIMSIKITSLDPDIADMLGPLRRLGI